MDLKDIPGYEEAVREEREIRGRVCIGVSRLVCGLELRPLKFRDFVNLCGMKCPFMCGGFISKMDCLKFLCLLEVNHREPGRGFFERWLAKRRNSRVLRKLAGVSGLQMISEINKYIEEMFLDSPSSSESFSDSAPIASSSASIIDQLASSYGWCLEQIMDAEMPLIFQLFRIRHVAEGGKRSALINRKSSKVLGEYLRTVNAAKQ